MFRLTINRLTKRFHDLAEVDAIDIGYGEVVSRVRVIGDIR